MVNGYVGELWWAAQMPATPVHNIVESHQIAPPSCQPTPPIDKQCLSHLIVELQPPARSWEVWIAGKITIPHDFPPFQFTTRFNKRLPFHFPRENWRFSFAAVPEKNV